MILLNHKVKNKRGIIDRRRLMTLLDEQAGTLTDSEARKLLLVTMKEALAKGRTRVQDILERDRNSAPEAAASLAYLVDQVIRIIYDFGVKHLYPNGNPTDAERFAILAVGGYGRGELAPYSDLDLLFLIPYKATPWVESMVEFVLYLLWDLGLKVGQAVRTIDDCMKMAKSDITIQTNLLDARYLWGDQEIASHFFQAYENDIRLVKGAGLKFVEAKLAERDARHTRTGDSRYMVEPNLKEGKGGMRDLHALFWLARFIYGIRTMDELIDLGVLEEDELMVFEKAESFLWAVRFHLHDIAGRAEERLTFDYQQALAQKLQYKDHPGLSGLERFMKHYYLVAKDIGDLTRIFCAVLEERQQKKSGVKLKKSQLKNIDGFRVDGDRLALESERDFEMDPLKMIRLFTLANEKGLDIHPDALRNAGNHLRLIDNDFRDNPEANKLFLDLLCSKKNPAFHLRLMNEVGVFGRFVPDFGRIVAQMQHDMYHHYTVDEHTIRAIDLTAKLENGDLKKDHPIASKVIQQLTTRRVLYVAVLLHDIAKGRGGDHSELGEQVAKELCPRFGMTAAQTDVVAWLVRWHLLMSHAAFKRDIADPQTIEDFVAIVQSRERLKLLYLLTIVDIRAVGPNVWSSWKRQLLNDLYFAAEERLMAGHANWGREERVSQKITQIKKRLAEWPVKKLTKQIERLPSALWIAEDQNTIEQNIRLMDATDKAKQDLGVMVRPQDDGRATLLSVYTKDERGAFARIAGGLAVAGGSIVDAKVFTTKDGMILDNILFQTPRAEAVVMAETLSYIQATVTKALSTDIDQITGIRRQVVNQRISDKYLTVEPFIVIDNKASKNYTVVEVNARDRTGLIFDISRVFFERGIAIHSAHVATFGERAVDVFYVHDGEGQKITHGASVKALESRLLAATELNPTIFDKNG